MRQTVIVDRRSFQMQIVISVEEGTGRVTATYPLKMGAKKSRRTLWVKCWPEIKRKITQQTVTPLLVLHIADSTLW